MPTRKEIDDLCDELGLEDILLADGYDEAFIGFVQRFGLPLSALYDRNLYIRLLVERDGMTEEDAEEYFEFNVAGAYVGETTPAFAVLHYPKRGSDA